MPVIHTPDTPYAKEMVRHEALHTQYGPPGRPYVYAEYPVMLYRADRGELGVPTFDGQVANDAHEQRNLESRGFVRGGQAKALEALEARDTEHGTLAAERAWEIKHGRVSEKAAAEVAAYEASAGVRHVPEIPSTPIKRRGRPRKTSVPVSGE